MPTVSSGGDRGQIGSSHDDARLGWPTQGRHMTMGLPGWPVPAAGRVKGRDRPRRMREGKEREGYGTQTHPC